MTVRPMILHLVDDTTAGGVMRVLDFLSNDAQMAQTAEHRVLGVTRGALWPRLEPADMIVSHLTLSWRTIPALVALKLRFSGSPIVHVEHSYTEAFTELNVPNRKRFFAMLRTAFALFDRVVSVSYGQAAWLEKEGLCSESKLHVIQSCVDLGAFRAIAPAVGPVRHFGAIGRFDRQKGFDDLILAFTQIKDPALRLTFFGKGEDESHLRYLAREDSRITFAGFVETPSEVMTDLDAVVMPSRWEAYGLVAIETLAAGRALVCFDIDGLSDHGPYGAKLVPGTSTDAFNVAMRDIIEDDTALGSPSPLRQGPVLEAKFRQGWRELITQGLT